MSDMIPFDSLPSGTLQVAEIIFMAFLESEPRSQIKLSSYRNGHPSSIRLVHQISTTKPHVSSDHEISVEYETAEGETHSDRTFYTPGSELTMARFGVTRIVFLHDFVPLGFQDLLKMVNQVRRRKAIPVL